jgi:hypothetical protein
VSAVIMAQSEALDPVIASDGNDKQTGTARFRLFNEWMALSYRQIGTVDRPWSPNGF